MKKQIYKEFIKEVEINLKRRKALYGQIELTYRCNLNCIHCYCRGFENNGELTLQEWKKILDELYRESVVQLALTGGEPLLRKDFLNIYAYTKRKGFLITILTNGLLLEDNIIKYFSKYPPYSIEITLNGITKLTYESITQVEGSYKRIMTVINKLKSANLPVVLKTNGFKQNKDEILLIKSLAERLFGKKRFKFDSFITPRLNGDKTPCDFRLTPEEITKMEESDPDMTVYRQELFHRPLRLERNSECLYHCDTWLNQFFIDPYGRLKFCLLSYKYSSNLKETSFKEGFYKFLGILDERWQTDSKCRTCELKMECAHCPGRAYLEIGDEEEPVGYFCELARMINKRKRQWLLNRKRKCLTLK
jgi:radical SAM protein with 4Fe4S-binding SPASM domain